MTTSMPSDLKSDQIIRITVRSIWEKQGHAGEPPPPLTPQILWDWMPPFDLQEFFKDFLDQPYLHFGHHHMTKMGLFLSPYYKEQPESPPHLWHDIQPPSDWKDRTWHEFSMCFYRHEYDVPTELPNDVLTLIEEHLNGSSAATKQLQTYNITELPSYSETQVRFQAYYGMLLLLAREHAQVTPEDWGIENAIEAIYDLYAEVNNKHPGRFKFPLAPVIEAWIADQIPKAKPEHRPRQIAPGFLKDSRLVKTDTLLPIGHMHAQAPESPMLPGFEPEGSALVPALPLDIYSTGTGSGAGAPIDERIWMNALIALPYGQRVPHRSHRTVELKTTLRDIRDWLYPNGWTRTRQLPLIINALHRVHNKRIAYQRRQWSLVQVIAMPDLTTKLDDPLPFYVMLPDGIKGNGAMIDVETMRLYGTQSAPKFRGWIRLAYLWDEAKKRNGGYPIYATIPEVLRNQQQHLTYPNGDLILSGKPKKGKDGKWHVPKGNQPQTAWYHPWATRTGRDIDNSNAKKVPVLTNSDLVALFYNDSVVNRSTFDTRLREAKDAARAMQADGNVAIEEDTVDPKRGVKGWRIIQAHKQKTSDDKT